MWAARELGQLRTSVIDLKGDLRGEITVTQVERGLYLPTQVNLITSYGSLSQVMKDIAKHRRKR